MGIIYDMISSMNEDSLGDIVMEADDITNDAKQGASDMSGEGSSGSSDIDLDTDNIFAKGDPTQSKSNADDANASSGNSDDTSEDTENNESSEDDGDSGDLEDGEEDELELADNESNNPEQNSDSPEILQKKRLKKQMLHLYDTIEDDIKLLSETMPNVTTAETAIALGNIKKNLVQCNGYIQQILKEEYGLLEYPILKKKFLSLSQVYDLCVRAIDIYFKKNRSPEKDND